MSTLMITLLVAFVVTVFAITCLAIGWLISGRSRIVRGSCGMNPNQSKGDTCGKDVQCGICESNLKEMKSEVSKHDNGKPPTPSKH